MTDNGMAEIIDEMKRTVTLSLEPQGGRIFAVTSTSTEPSSRYIELKCHLYNESIFQWNEIIIGSDRHSRHNLFADEFGKLSSEDGQEDKIEEEDGWRLSSIPIMISIHKMNKNTEYDEIGFLGYNKKYESDDGLIKNEWPTCNASIYVGENDFETMERGFFEFKEFNYKIGIDVNFSSDCTTSGWGNRVTHWNGLGQLPISRATVVWFREDWSSSFRRRLFPNNTNPTPIETPSREHSELLEATTRIESAISALKTPLWLAVGVALMVLIARH
ncbi:MAG: hypothetical protein JSS36_11530 [Proteobacteria bacterium]|nr:hypothetical protein [Pseudomonadota bacterium]